MIKQDSQESMVFVSDFQDYIYLFAFIDPLSIAGDKAAASFTGTHEPGQFCFFISGPTAVPLGPAAITSPSNLQMVLTSSVSLVAQGLLNSREYSIQANGQVIGSATSTSTGTLSSTLDLSAVADGSLTISLIRVSDTTTSASVTIRKDTGTSVSITTPTSGSYINSLTASDFYVEGTGEADATVVATFTDSLGSTSQIQATVQANGVIWGAYTNIGGLAEGPVTLVATATDSAGFMATSQPVELTKDTTTTGVITSPSNGGLVRTSVTVSGTAEPRASVSLSLVDEDDATSDISVSSISADASGTWTSGNINIATQTDGSVRILATFRDAAGNTASSTVRVNKDTVASVSLTSPSSGSFINAITSSAVQMAGSGDAYGTVSVTATDSLGSTLTTTTTSNGQQNWRMNANLASLADGVVTLVASITDLAGNQAVSRTVSINKDTVTFVTITSPSQFTFINQNNVHNLQISGSGEVGGMVVVNVQDSSSSTPNIQTTAVQVTPQGTWTVTADLSTQAEGSVRVSGTITDAVGNTFTSNAITLSKDTVVSVVIASPTNQQFVVTTTRASSMSIAGYGDPGTRVFVTISDSDRNTANIVSTSVVVSPVGTWSLTANLITLQDGDLTLIAAATDAAGNIGTSNTVSLNKDTMVSGFAITTPSTGTAISQAQASTLTISGTGEPGGRVSLRIAGSSGLISKTVSVGAAGTWASTVNIATLPNGTITISGTATDVGGNSGAISAVAITKM